MADDYKNHHYVPQWYQKKFMLPGEHELFYLDMKPGSFIDSRGITHAKKSVWRQGSKKCFVEEDLYTAKIRGIENRDIEKYFFGAIDRKGRPATEYFESFSYPFRKYWGTSLQDILLYMSAQKLRTPKGIEWLSNQIRANNRENILRVMVSLSQLHCAIWMECVWLIADASKSKTKFIISDHPVAVYNRECGSRSQWCRNYNDPDIRFHGTHTIFPLSIDKILILTNLSWVRNPYQSAIKLRPNPNYFRGAIFKFTDVQIMRNLDEQEVREINFIIKSQSLRYIAAAKEEWLYPNKYISKSNWNTFGNGYLLMPDPRSIHCGGEIMWGNTDGTSGAMDEYGRLPYDPDYSKETKSHSENHSLQWFQGEFAKLVGPYRRGRSFQGMRIDSEKDDEEFHNYHLSLQRKKYKERHKK